MDTTEFGRVFAGTTAYMTRNFDAEKYHWKLKVGPKGLAKPAIANQIDDEYEARILALACAYLGISWWGLTSAHCKVKDEWRAMLESPALAVEQIKKLQLDSFEDLVKDSNRGAMIHQLLVSGEIHFVTFAYVVLTTHCTKTWQSLYWKTQKEKLLKIIRGLDIDVARVLQFASLLRKELQ